MTQNYNSQNVKKKNTIMTKTKGIRAKEFKKIVGQQRIKIM
jgi:hypothetical protein